MKYKIFGKSEWGSDIIEFLCHEISIEYEFVEIGDNFKSDKTILNVNPLGRVPMVETPNGEYLIESMAIVYHFIERESQLIPDTKNGITDFHQIMAFMSSSIYPAILLYFHPDHYVSTENTEDLVNRSKSILETYLNYLEKKIKIFSLEYLPRITRAQSMDVLSSQSNLAGYRAVVDCVSEFEKAVPMMMTAAGTVPAAKVLVILSLIHI